MKKIIIIIVFAALVIVYFLGIFNDKTIYVLSILWGAFWAVYPKDKKKLVIFCKDNNKIAAGRAVVIMVANNGNKPITLTKLSILNPVGKNIVYGPEGSMNDVIGVGIIKNYHILWTGLRELVNIPINNYIVEALDEVNHPHYSHVIIKRLWNQMSIKQQRRSQNIK